MPQLEYQQRRRGWRPALQRRFIAGSLVAVFVVLALTWFPELAAHLRRLKLEAACARHEMETGKIVYDRAVTPAAGRNGIGDGYDLYKELLKQVRVRAGPEALLVMHERVSSGGVRRLVVVCIADQGGHYLPMLRAYVFKLGGLRGNTTFWSCEEERISRDLFLGSDHGNIQFFSGSPSRQRDDAVILPFRQRGRGRQITGVLGDDGRMSFSLDAEAQSVEDAHSSDVGKGERDSTPQE
jgi:hypothetical protein